MVTHCNSEADRKAIEALCRIHKTGQLGRLLEDFAYRERELPGRAALANVFATLDAEEVGRAAEHLLGIRADHAAALALEIVLPDRRRQLALEMIRDADQGDRASSDRRQQSHMVTPISAVDRANRHAAAHRYKIKRRASA